MGPKRSTTKIPRDFNQNVSQELKENARIFQNIPHKNLESLTKISVGKSTPNFDSKNPQNSPKKIAPIFFKLSTTYLL